MLAALPHTSAVTVISNSKINALTSISVTGAADYSLKPISSGRGEARGPLRQKRVSNRAWLKDGTSGNKIPPSQVKTQSPVRTTNTPAKRNCRPPPLSLPSQRDAPFEIVFSLIGGPRRSTLLRSSSPRRRVSAAM